MPLPLEQDPEINRNFLPTPKLSVSEWADEHRMLDPMFSAEPGQWDTNRAAYAREWMDSASCRWVRAITVMAGTQVGKTEAANNIVGYFVQHAPAPIMLVMPRASDAKLAAKRRILPMVLASESLRDEMTERAQDLGSREMQFKRCVLYFRSAQSPADLASVPVKVVLLDELDKYPVWTKREASPLSLVEERTRTFYDRLIVTTSTPTTRDGNIAKRHAQGDQRKYYVPCVECSGWQVFKWANVKKPEDITTAEQMTERREAWYECEHCGAKLDDRAKIKMVAVGVWVPEGWDVEAWVTRGQREDRAPHRSYHLWAAYSPWLTWWEIMAKFLADRHDPALLMNYVNSWLAEVWEERVETTTDEQILACIEPERPQYVIPGEVQVLTGSVDVQKDRMEWAVHGWGLDEESWLIAAGKVTSWDALADVLFRNQWGEAKPMQLRCVLIDSRHRRDEVIDFARRWRPVVRMIQGVESDAPQPFKTTKIERHPRTGLPLPNALTVWSVQVAWFKDLLASRLQRTAEGSDTRHGLFHLPNDLDEQFLTQLASEQKIRVRSGARVRSAWVLKPGHVRNEAWDLCVYNVAAARLIRCDLLKSPENPNAPPRPEPPPQRPRRDRRPNRFPMLGGDR